MQNIIFFSSAKKIVFFRAILFSSCRFESYLCWLIDKIKTSTRHIVWQPNTDIESTKSGLLFHKCCRCRVLLCAKMYLSQLSESSQKNQSIFNAQQLDIWNEINNFVFGSGLINLNRIIDSFNWTGPLIEYCSRSSAEWTRVRILVQFIFFAYTYTNITSCLFRTFNISCANRHSTNVGSNEMENVCLSHMT